MIREWLKSARREGEGAVEFVHRRRRMLRASFAERTKGWTAAQKGYAARVLAQHEKLLDEDEQRAKLIQSE